MTLNRNRNCINGNSNWIEIEINMYTEINALEIDMYIEINNYVYLYWINITIEIYTKINVLEIEIEIDIYT